jgi:hypothetical protein
MSTTSSRRQAASPTQIKSAQVEFFGRLIWFVDILLPSSRAKNQLHTASLD